MSSNLIDRSHGVLPEKLLGLIPADAQYIVEFGCQVGELARRYKPINPHCTYIGVEANPDAAQQAAQFCDRVWVGKAESIDDRLFGDVWGKIDCIIYNGVLEYLDDAAGLLERHAVGLKSEGAMIASLPNFQYWQALQGLFRGSWQESNPGAACPPEGRRTSTAHPRARCRSRSG